MPPVPPSNLCVAVDAAALRDGRASAGIGRYVRGLIHGLEAIPGIEVVPCSPSRPPRPDAWAIRFLNAQPAQFRARRQRHGGRPTVLHATSGDPSLVWPPAAQVVTLHDVEPWRSPTQGGGVKHRLTAGYFAMQRTRFRRCGAIIAVSNATADDACALLAIDRSRVHVIGEGAAPVFTVTADTESGDAALRRAAGVDQPGYIVWVGSLRAHDPRKALDVLVDAVARVEPATPLVLVGQRGDEADRVVRRARDMGLAITTTGYVGDASLAALYRGAGAVAIPSRHEGFGLPMIEAMACGAPVVATAVANLVQLGRDDAAVMVPAGDPSALATALSRVLSNGPLTARLRVRGPARAAEHGWDDMCRRTAAVYREVAARRSR